MQKKGLISRAGLSMVVALLAFASPVAGEEAVAEGFATKVITVVVPEPGTLLLLASGLVGVGLVALWRRRVAQAGNRLG